MCFFRVLIYGHHLCLKMPSKFILEFRVQRAKQQITYIANFSEICLRYIFPSSETSVNSVFIIKRTMNMSKSVKLNNVYIGRECGPLVKSAFGVNQEQEQVRNEQKASGPQIFSYRLTQAHQLKPNYNWTTSLISLSYDQNYLPRLQTLTYEK